MDFERIAPRTSVPVPLCRDMPGAMLANATQASNAEPVAVRKLDEAMEQYRDWVEMDGKAEKQVRKAKVDYWNEQVFKHRSDRKHWTLMHSAWRKELVRHPELDTAVAGTVCTHGYIAPMCSIAVPDVVVRSRTPGEDDE